MYTVNDIVVYYFRIKTIRLLTTMESYRRLARINGYYDILFGLCWIGILNIPYVNDLNARMFSTELDPIAKRFIGYYVLLQGIVRMNAKTSKDDRQVMTTYLLEALLFANEVVVHNNVQPKESFIASTCACLWFAYIFSGKK